MEIHIAHLEVCAGRGICHLFAARLPRTKAQEDRDDNDIFWILYAQELLTS